MTYKDTDIHLVYRPCIEVWLRLYRKFEFYDQGDFQIPKIRNLENFCSQLYKYWLSISTLELCI